VISSLQGQVQFIRNGLVVVDVGGVGYAVRVSSSALEKVPRVGQRIELYTHLMVRENDISLYGFVSLAELESFELLLGVTGVGPRVALSILSTLSPESLRQIIAQGDVAALTHVPGIGRKTAERLMLYLRDKLAPAGGAALVTTFSANDLDAINALTALGYSVAEAQSALAAIPAEVDGLDARILAALRSLGSG
jgi:Holliday junction DNA helicase RuvA